MESTICFMLHLPTIYQDHQTRIQKWDKWPFKSCDYKSSRIFVKFHWSCCYQLFHGKLSKFSSLFKGWESLFHWRKDILFNLFMISLKCLYGQQGFYSYGTSILCKKVFWEKKIGFWDFNALNLALKFPLQPLPMKLTESQCRKGSGFLNGSWHQVRNHEILLV